MAVSMLPSPARQDPRRAAARVGPSLAAFGTDISGADVILSSPLRAAGFCSAHLLPFAGEISVAQLPLGREGVLAVSAVRRTLQRLCAQPRHPARLTRALADALELERGPLSILISAQLRHACGGCSALNPESGESHAAVARGAFRFRPDLAQSVGLFMRQIGQDFEDDSAGLRGAR